MVDLIIICIKEKDKAVKLGGWGGEGKEEKARLISREKNSQKREHGSKGSEIRSFLACSRNHKKAWLTWNKPGDGMGEGQKWGETSVVP